MINNTTQTTNVALTELEAMKLEIARLSSENFRLANKTTKASGGISFRVSEKGCVSVYGLGRFPVTLYKKQWAKLLGSKAELESFIVDNDSKLTDKE